MISLFSKKGRAALDKLLASDPLLAFDFDGTIAPFADDPRTVRTLKPLLPLLKTLAKRHPVAIVSGRARPELTRLLGFKSRYVVGNHGLEGVPSGKAAAARARKITRTWVKQLADEPLVEGLFVENKSHSLSIHFRTSSVAGIGDKIHRRALALDPKPRIITGRDVINIVPQGSPHKGDAIRELLKHSGRSKALFAGDDITDEDVFRTMGANLLGVRVGRKKSSRAKYYVKSLNDMEKLLKLLVDFQEKS